MKTLEQLYADIAAMTLEVCKTCDPPYHCEHMMGCMNAAHWAKAVYKIDLKEVSDGEMMFLTPTGCSLPPHHRPLCSMWLCPQAKEPEGYRELKAEITRRECDRWRK